MISFDIVFPVNCSPPFEKLDSMRYTTVPTFSRVSIVQTCRRWGPNRANPYFLTAFRTCQDKMEEMGNFHAIYDHDNDQNIKPYNIK